MTRTAGQAATALFVLSAALQLTLAAGVLPITMAWGGRVAELTPELRVASVVAAFVLLGFAYVIRARAGLVARWPPGRGARIAAWVITAYLALNLLGNLTSSSLGEKALFGPLSALLVVSCAMVSLGRSDTA